MKELIKKLSDVPDFSRASDFITNNEQANEGLRIFSKIYQNTLGPLNYERMVEEKMVLVRTDPET